VRRASARVHDGAAKPRPPPVSFFLCGVILLVDAALCLSLMLPFLIRRFSSAVCLVIDLPRHEKRARAHTRAHTHTHASFASIYSHALSPPAHVCVCRYALVARVPQYWDPTCEEPRQVALSVVDSSQQMESNCVTLTFDPVPRRHGGGGVDLKKDTAGSAAAGPPRS
jgi:hypothetical protein